MFGRGQMPSFIELLLAIVVLYSMWVMVKLIDHDLEREKENDNE